MTGIAVTWAAPGSAEWVAERPHGLGGSEIAVITGHNPFKTPHQLWREKRGDADPFTGNYATERGSWLEPFILRAYALEHPGTIIERPGDFPSVIAHPDYPYIRCSLDGLAHTPDTTTILEAKAITSRGAHHWDDGQVPDMYAVQVMWQMAVTGLRDAVVVADVAGKYVERVIPWDERFAGEMLTRAVQWWDTHVVRGIEPDDDVPVIPLPDESLPPVVVDPDLAARVRAAKAAEVDARRALADVSKQMQDEMGAATKAVTVDGDVVATWHPVKGRQVADVAALKADGLWDQYTRTTDPTRMFRLKGWAP